MQYYCKQTENLHIPLSEKVVLRVFHEDTGFDWKSVAVWLPAACWYWHRYARDVTTQELTDWSRVLLASYTAHGLHSHNSCSCRKEPTRISTWTSAAPFFSFLFCPSWKFVWPQGTFFMKYRFEGLVELSMLYTSFLRKISEILNL